MNMPSFLRYWGKSALGEHADYHPLVWHCLDVAAVVAAMLDGDELLLRRIANLAHLDRQTVRSWLPVIAALHDLGKFGRGFQHQVGELRDRLTGAPLPLGQLRPANSPRHDALGLVLWRNAQLDLAGLLGIREAGVAVTGDKVRQILEPWVAAATGHHGRPAFDDKPLNEVLDRQDQAAVQDWVRQVVAVLKPGVLEWPVARGADLLKPSSWLVAGLVTLADWQGSNQEFFRYSPDVVDVVDYWDMAQTRARRAVSESDLLPHRVRPSLALADLTAGGTATPLQHAVAAHALPAGPQLHVIEDLTGSGKTEAALLLAHRLIQQGLGNGIYFALPTMATSNGMYARAAVWHGALFDDAGPEIVLAHAQADRVQRAAGDPSRYGKDGDVPAGRMRQSWLADNRKKALLAQMGIGTVDQALLGILKVKHSTLRQLGIARNVLIIDEVHAFDSYTGRLIEVLLELQAMHGGSAVVLSATLTRKLREKLVAAFWKGLQAAKLPTATVELVFGEQPVSTSAPPPACIASAYPLWTNASAVGAVETAIGPSPSSCRKLPVRFVHSEADVVAELGRATAVGLCAVWIRNTVDDALRAEQALRDAGVAKTSIFHARMMAGDRGQVEKQVLKRYGKGSAVERAGHVLVATQVVEQSLDIDFDLMVSDLAPADLLVQRAGRLHRHRRQADGALTDGPDKRPLPELVVLAPAWADEPAANWLTALLPGTEAVYRDPAMLWRTQQVLQDRGAIELPNDARHLVEVAVAGEEVPPAFANKVSQAEGKAISISGMAELNKIQADSGYFNLDVFSQWHEDAEMPTRIGDPTERLRLARRDGDRLLPLCSAWLSGADWFDADVQVRAGRVDTPAAAMEQFIANAAAAMPDGGRWTTTVVLSEDAYCVWRGQGIEYRETAGLSFAGKGHRK